VGGGGGGGEEWRSRRLLTSRAAGGQPQACVPGWSAVFSGPSFLSSASVVLQKKNSCGPTALQSPSPSTIEISILSWRRLGGCSTQVSNSRRPRDSWFKRARTCCGIMACQWWLCLLPAPADSSLLVRVPAHKPTQSSLSRSPF